MPSQRRPSKRRLPLACCARTAGCCRNLSPKPATSAAVAASPMCRFRATPAWQISYCGHFARWESSCDALRDGWRDAACGYSLRHDRHERRRSSGEARELMGFLAPGVFILGAALAAAVLASYLLRPRRPARRVSSTFLWLAALHDLESQRPWRRVPPSLLLLLQLAALVALVAAVARPFTLTTQSTGAFSVVLLDASASMQATDVKPSRFEVARGKVTQLIDSLEPGQQLAVVS